MTHQNDLEKDPVASHLNAFWLGETDLWLLAEGRHLRPWEKLGAHPCHLNGVDGTALPCGPRTHGRFA